ncbi:MAG: peptidylprolyl isomerase [Deltaproteobacteria bacterium]|nr:MAG: peptidylprolyl isomerase [Deltaproteobacteria bacterium]
MRSTLLALSAALLLTVGCDSSESSSSGEQQATQTEKKSGKMVDLKDGKIHPRPPPSKESIENRRKIAAEAYKARSKKELKGSVADDGWVAPPSTANRDACAGAEGPKSVDPGSLQPLPLPKGAHAALTDPSKATETAPDVFKVRFETTAGDFVIEAHRDWAPIGVDRFYNLVKIGYFDQARFFRNVAGFMVQFGISDFAEVNAVWKDARIKDERVKMGNRRGVVTFAKCGAPDCRSTQIFINHRDNINLDGMGFAGFGRVVEGMDVVDKLHTCYGEGQPNGRGPRQDLVQRLGGAYLEAGYPNLDQVKRATIVD